MAIFKYFTEEAHALSLIDKGELMLQPLSHFRGREADGVRGDPRDGILTYAPKDGLVMDMEDGRAIKLAAGSFNSTVNQHDIYVYCSSNRLSAELAVKFGPFCVELSDPTVLVRRLTMRAHPTSAFDYEQIVCDKVDYRPHDREPGVDWALPERLVLVKPEAFSWQDEHRIAVGKHGALDVENVGLTIHTGPAAAVPIPTPPPVFLKVGPLSEHVTFHRF